MSQTRLQLLRYFQEYASIVYASLSRLTVRESRITHLTPAQRARLLEAVEWLESQPVFRELVGATWDAYRDEKHHSSKFYIRWESAVKNFFRRSGFYLNCFEGAGTSDWVGLFQKYEQAFQACEALITYLLPLEGVQLVEFRDGVIYLRRDPIECDSFTIKRYSKEELEELSGNRVNRTFYPQCVWDTERLSHYWYLVVGSRKPVTGIGKVIIDFTGLNKIKRRSAPGWLAPFQMVLYRLVLYDWIPDGFQLHRELIGTWPRELEGFCWPATGIRFSVDSVERFEKEQYLSWVPWYGFRLPFRLECDDELLHEPPVAQGTSVLEMEFHGELGVEEVEWPAIWFELGEKATAELARLINKDLSIIDTELLEQWPFFQRALEYLLKAFLTDPDKAPAEQLLWHVTTLEALLGRKEDKPIVGAIARRLGRLLGINARERDRVGYHFRKLYEIRSDLVHGNPWKDYSTLYLYLARNLARQACLRYAELATSCIQKGRPLPNRDQIITALDEGWFDELLGKEP